MRKKLLSLFLAMGLVLSLAAPASAARINVSNMPGHEMLSFLPATLQRPAYPATVRQTDPLMTRFTDFAHKEETWPYEQSLESVFQEMVSLTDSLTAGKTTDTQKVKAIFEWVSQNVEYGILIDGIDEEGYLSKVDAYADPLQVYIRRHARCEGYALMCQFMCTIAGIPTAYIAGKAQGSGILHAWNAALADGGWIFFDATWREWDMAPNYHSSTDQLAYYDGVFLIQVFPKGVSDGYDVRLRLRTGFSCPNSVTVPGGVTWVDLKNHPNLTDITLPDSVTEVYFTGCTGLTNVTLPNSMTGIEGGAFNGCTSLKSVKLPASLTTIGNSAFMGCTSLKSVAIPDSVTTLENLAFAQSGLTSVTVPGSVTRMEAAFYECADLESVTLSRGITSIQDSMFMGCTSLKNVTIPDTVKTIEGQAFWNCTSLESITIPDGVTSIGKLAFADCKSLKQADLPDSVTSIDGSAFTGCTSLKQSAAIPGGMTAIADGTFQDRTDLTSFVIPDHITEIGNWAFRNCTNLQSVTIPDSVTTIDSWAFYGCTSLESVTLPSSVTTIGNYAFGGCTGMTSMTIPEGVVSIGHYATSYTLTNITIPTSVTSIGGGIFGGSMTDVYYAGTEAQWKAISIGEPNYLDRVTVHYNSAGPQPQEPVQPGQAIAYASTQSVLVDGRSVEFYAYALKDANGNDTNYVKLRDVAQVLSGSAAQFEVGWDGSVNMETGKAYTSNGSEMVQNFTGNQSYTVSTAPVKVNGVAADLEAIVLTDAKGGGYTYFKLRDLGAALGFNVGYAGGTGIFIQTDRPYTDAD